MVKIVKSQRGQILVLTALMLIPLVAMVGVAVDSGYLFYLKRTMQTAADSPGWSVGGAATIDAPGCGIYVRSSSSSAMSASGSVTAKTIDVVGAATGKGPFSPTPTGGAFALPDPLAGLSAPSLGACVEAPGSGSINPNIPSAPYCSINVSSATFNPGTYYIKGSGPGCTGTGPTLVCGTLKPGTGKTVSGDKVVFFIASGGISITGKWTLNLSVAVAGSYAGRVLYQATGDTNTTDI